MKKYTTMENKIHTDENKIHFQFIDVDKFGFFYIDKFGLFLYKRMLKISDNACKQRRCDKTTG